MRFFSIVFVIFALGISYVVAEQAADKIAPEPRTEPRTEATTQIAQKPQARATKHMVATANPHASRAALKMLEAGGNAIDAMVAAQMVLGLVEPQSSGLGGGAFLVYYDGKNNKLTTFDGRETAPLAATPELFLDDAGKPLKFFDAVIGGRSVGTPGTVKLMAETHKKFGKLSWAMTLSPAIELAEQGFEISPRLHALIEKSKESLKRYQTTKVYFFDEAGEPRKIGELLKNPEYARSLKIIAQEGAKGFYHGELAKALVDRVQNAPNNPGVLSLKDLASYQIKIREPICQPYRGFDICGMGPPSSGALTVGQILGQLSHFPLKEMGENSVEAWRLIGDASRLAFADRGRYMADSDFVKMPEGLLNKAYLADRAKLLKGSNALTKDQVKAGMPPWEEAQNWGYDEAIELPSTSHLSIVDGEGNVVSLTTTIENGFGSRLMVGGFLLNNELTDFSFRTEKDGKPIANRVEAGKRPRSSMSPTIVLKDGKPYMAVGSPGGSRIIGYVAKTLIAHFDWGMNMQQAIELPHLVNRFGTYDLEEGTSAENFKAPLEALGFKVKVRPLNSGLHGIIINEGHLLGGADPRREGLVLGK